MLTENTSFVKLVPLKNGYSNLRQKNGIHYLNTVSLDVVLYIIACFYADSTVCRIFFESAASEELIKFMQSFTKNGATENTYKCRNDILRQIFDEKKEDGLRIINCDGNVSYIIHNFFSSVLASVVVTGSRCKCRKRESIGNIPFFSIDCDFRKRNLSQEIDDIVQELLPKSESVCNVCKISYEQEYQLNDIVFFVINENSHSIQVGWDEIPKVIMLRDSVYILAGVIEIILPISEAFKTHYVSYVLRTNSKWHIFDSSKKDVFVLKGSQKLTPHLLVFVLPKMIQNIPKIVQSQGKEECTLTKEYSLRLLRNFHISEKDGSTTYLKNSCGPDSILQCLASCYKDSHMFRNSLDTESFNSPLIDFIEIFCRNDDFDSVNSKRSHLYQKYFPVTNTGGMKTINCEGNIFDILKILVTPILPSITSMFQCDCGQTSKKFPLIDINLEILAACGIDNLETAVNEKFICKQSQKICHKCNSDQLTTNTLGNIVFFNVEPLKKTTTTIGISEAVQISRIPTQINLLDQMYDLKAIIEYVDTGNLGHYIAHCRNDAKWYQFNNLSSQVSRSPTTLQPTILAYIKNDF